MWSDRIFYPVYFVVVILQSPSCVRLFMTPWTAACQASLFLTVSQSHLIVWCPLLLLPSTFPSIGTFPTSCLFASDDQNTGASASASVLPVNIPGLSPLRLTGLISLLSMGLSGIFSSSAVWRHQKFFGVLPSLWSNSHNHTWPLGRPYPWYTDLCWQSTVCAFQHIV